MKLSRKRKWNIILMAGGGLISVFFLLFTNYLVKELSTEELEKVQNLSVAYSILNSPDTTVNLTPYRDIIINNTSIPLLVVDETDQIRLAKNFDEARIKDTSYLRGQLRVMRFYNSPIKMNIGKDIWFVYYKEKDAVTMLRYFPFIQLLLIGIYIVISYVAFSTNRRFEQNRVWVGMAKETAHQIGTPLSSLMAWVEYLKNIEGPPGEEVITELEKDLTRLEIITERFSKIGSTPELKEYNIYDVLAEAIDYLKRRISKKVKIYLTEDSHPDTLGNINKNLFDWVIENLTKNAVDAMDGVGEISFRLRTGKDYISIDVKDSGKGIPKGNFKTVFDPGYTTRKRGWGLGLSLSKRIIENYHNGEIFVKESEPGKGTTFRIKLQTPKGELKSKS